MKGFWIKFRLPGHELVCVVHMDMTDDATEEAAALALEAMRPGSKILTINGHHYEAADDPANARLDRQEEAPK